MLLSAADSLPVLRGEEEVMGKYFRWYNWLAGAMLFSLLRAKFYPDIKTNVIWSLMFMAETYCLFRLIDCFELKSAEQPRKG